MTCKQLARHKWGNVHITDLPAKHVFDADHWKNVCCGSRFLEVEKLGTKVEPAFAGGTGHGARTSNKKSCQRSAAIPPTDRHGRSCSHRARTINVAAGVLLLAPSPRRVFHAADREASRRQASCPSCPQLARQGSFLTPLRQHPVYKDQAMTRTGVFCGGRSRD